MIPPRSILVAVDFSDASRVTLGYAARFANHCHAQLHVVHAEDPLLCAAARAAGVDLAGETREELDHFTHSALPANNAAPPLHVIVGAAVDVVCNIADREQVDLVVMGTHGMTATARAMFGSVTEGVLLRSNVSVLAVPASWRPPHLDAGDLSGTGPIVAGLELTTPAIAATSAACRLAQALGTSVEAVHAVPPIRVLDRWRTHAEAAVADRIESARRELVALLPQLRSEVPVALHVEFGDIAERLAAVATSTPDRHPVLVIGRRPPGARRGPPGAIASRALALAQIPVLVYLPED